MDNEEQVYMCANVVGAAKERAIMDAFNSHFGRKDWTEADVAELELTSVVDYYNHKETLVINGRPMVEFGMMESHTEIETGMVQCLYRQTIKHLYTGCGVGE